MIDGKNILTNLFLTIAALWITPNIILADETSDAAAILGGFGKKVKKWDKTPKISVITTGDFPKSDLESTIDFINNESNLGISHADIKFIDISKSLQSPFIGAYFRSNASHQTDQTASGILNIAGDSVQSDIFIFHVNRPLGAFLSIITESASGLPRLSREFAEGKSDCYFHIRSIKGRILTSYIFISSESSRYTQEQCVYEELVQSMGLIADANKSQFFTFDDAIPKKDDNLDWKILRSLYNKEVRPNDGVDSVIGIYKGLMPSSEKSYPPKKEKQ